MEPGSRAEMLGAVAGILFGFWPVILLTTALFAVLGRSSLRRMGLGAPWILLIMWAALALLRLAMSIFPPPVVFVMVNEPLSTRAFLLAGPVILALCLLAPRLAAMVPPSPPMRRYARRPRP